MVDLRKDGEAVREAWRSSEAPHVPLPLAAALAFHETSGAVRAVTQLEYDDALDLAAAALSRLLPIYTLDERTKVPVSVQLNLGTGRFRQGATVYERRNGRRALTSLVVQRERLPAAMELIKATGIPFQFDGEVKGGSALSRR